MTDTFGNVKSPDVYQLGSIKSSGLRLVLQRDFAPIVILSFAPNLCLADLRFGAKLRMTKKGGVFGLRKANSRCSIRNEN